MKHLNEFDIDIYNLSEKVHEYEFTIGNAFFENFKNSIIEKSNAIAKVYLDKQESMINLNLIIEGSIELICDRSLEKFDFPLSINENVYYKYGLEEKELSEDVMVITRNTQRINVAQFIYDFMGLAVPIKKLHPKFQGQEEDPLSEGEIVFSSDSENNQQENSQGDEEIDPRWQVLKNFKNNKN